MFGRAIVWVRSAPPKFAPPSSAQERSAQPTPRFLPEGRHFQSSKYWLMALDVLVILPGTLRNSSVFIITLLPISSSTFVSISCLQVSCRIRPKNRPLLHVKQLS